MNINSAVTEATNILKDKSILSAQLDTEILMAKALDKDREYIILNHDKVLNNENLEYFKKLVSERASRKPIAYLLNKKFFWKSEFYVNQNTLIPRPDTEIIIEQILKVTKNKHCLKILDIGVGSGCILLSILKEKKNFYGTGIDISKNSLEISRLNAKKLLVEERVKFYKSDVDKFDLGKYDLIVSNPPYIKSSDLKYLVSDVLKFEPRWALDGGLDGLSVIRKVINKTSELLKKNGKFILEIGFNQKNNNARKNNFRRNDRNFKSNGDRRKFASNYANNDSFKRKVPGRNNHNAPKLIEKYNDLAREASSNGDKILSENYLQHADHFTRILNEQENYKRLKSAENKYETQELSEKTEEISVEDKKVVAEIKPISKKKTEDS